MLLMKFHMKIAGYVTSNAPLLLVLDTSPEALIHLQALVEL